MIYIRKVLSPDVRPFSTETEFFGKIDRGYFFYNYHFIKPRKINRDLYSIVVGPDEMIYWSK